ncbi:MAG: TIR domain-containing protein [Clostridia bacterium]
MDLRQAICTNCGGTLQIDTENGNIGVCKYCGNEYIVENAIQLTMVDVDKTKDLINLRQLLKEAVTYNNILAILNYSSKIREIIPNDFSALYYHAYGEYKQNRPNEYNDFIATSGVDATPSEACEVLDHMIITSDLRYRAQIEAFIKSIKCINQSEFLFKHNRKTIEKKRLEENYDIVPRDCFICFRSTDTAIAESAVRCLEEDGNKCWISTRNLRPNDSENYWDTIEAAIDSCKVFVVITSEDAMLSGDVKNELRIAKGLNKPRIEYKIDTQAHTELFKDFFNGIMWIDATDNALSHLQDLSMRVFDVIEGMSKKKAPDKIDELKELIKQSSNNNNNTGNAPLNIDKLVANGEMFSKLGDFKQAYEVFASIIKNNPEDYRGWFGMVKVLTKQFSDINDKSHQTYLRSARAVANSDQRNLIESEYSVYVERLKRRDILLATQNNLQKDLSDENEQLTYFSTKINNKREEIKANNELTQMPNKTKVSYFNYICGLIAIALNIYNCTVIADFANGLQLYPNNQFMFNSFITKFLLTAFATLIVARISTSGLAKKYGVPKDIAKVFSLVAILPCISLLPVIISMTIKVYCDIQNVLRVKRLAQEVQYKIATANREIQNAQAEIDKKQANILLIEKKIAELKENLNKVGFDKDERIAI